MGCCMSKNLPPEHALIDNTLKKDHSLNTAISKILLLGPGESGKSTLFKQMTSIYGKGYTDEDRKGYREAVYVNVMTSVKSMSDYYDSGTDMKELKQTIGEAADSARQILLKAGDFTLDLVPQLQTFWADPAIQEVHALGARYHLNESSAYFFEQLDTIGKPDYVPTFQDIVRCRIRTTGIVELEFLVEKHIFKLFDMGGQRNERKKWIHCFENVTAVIFVAALSSYDQFLIEDEKVNRITEAINLFDDICNGKWFRKTAMILFLNKKDLFQDKIKKLPIITAFPEYTGKNEYTDTSEFIQKKFEERNRQKKQLYTHLTCATATDNIRMVFNAIKDIIIRAGLKDIGLV